MKRGPPIWKYGSKNHPEIKPWKPDPKAAGYLEPKVAALWLLLRKESEIQKPFLYQFEPTQLAYHFSVALAKHFGDRWEVKLGAETEEGEVTMPTPAQISLYFKTQSAKAAAKMRGTKAATERARKAGRAKKRPRTTTS
jgi:hypothetical protein